MMTTSVSFYLRFYLARTITCMNTFVRQRERETERDREKRIIFLDLIASERASAFSLQISTEYDE